MKKISALFLSVLLMMSLLSSVSSAEDTNIIVTLDPGHGKTSTGTDGAVQFGGVNEMYYNWTITGYCKERLQQYAGITVYVTKRNIDSTPSLEDRVKFAVNKHSDSIVSIHNNYSSKASVYGTQIYVPNNNYRTDMASSSMKLANKIMKRLNSDAGTYKRDSPYATNHDTQKYPDGSVADYWGIVRNAKLLGLNAGLIVECVFCSNKSDVENFLLKEEKLKDLGYAIADGIADYYKLKLSAPVTEPAATIAPATDAPETASVQTALPETTLPVTDTQEITQPVPSDNTSDSFPVWAIILIISAISAAAGVITYLIVKKRRLSE